MRKIVLSVLMVLLASFQLAAQNQRVSGTVTGPDDELMAGVAVVLKGTNVVAVTNADGQYSINAPTEGVLEFTYLGMITQEVPVSGRTIINVKLALSTEVIDDVMVIAYGTAKKESFTGSAAQIKSESLSKRTTTSVTKAIEGLAPGVQTSSGGGQPGSVSAVRIRGIGSINASSSPLYVVDGAPYDGNISSINPSDIESMTILKDASATALYGARGANGVIVITTKRGKSGRSIINYKGTVGFSNRAIKQYDLVDMDTFTELVYETIYNDYFYGSNYSHMAAHNQALSDMSSTFGGQFYNPYKNYTWSTLIDPATGKLQTDAKAAWNESWMDHIQNTNAIRHEHNLSVSGGTDLTQLALNIGYLKENGVLKTTEFDRFSTRLSVDHQARWWLKAGMSAAYILSNNNQPGLEDGSYSANAWYTAQFMSPIYPFYLKDDEGNDVLDQNGNKQFDWGATRNSAPNFHTLGLLELNHYSNVWDQVNTHSYIELGGDDEKMGVLRGLRFRLNYNLNLNNRRVTDYSNNQYGDGAASNGTIAKYATRSNSYTINQLLTYNRTFGDHGISVLVGHEYYDFRYDYLSGEKSGVYPGIWELAPAVTVEDTYSYALEHRVEGYFSRINYSYKDRYYFDASYRRDASSRFYKENRWGNFWSVGASWRISEELFLRDVEWVNNLTLKFSLGDMGNDMMLNSNGSQNYYVWDSYYNLTYANANNAGAIVTSLQNKGVSWEKKRAINTGIEASLLRNRLQVSAEYFHNKTTDLLLNSPMALSTGFTGYSDNIGDMVNQGMELTLAGNIINNKDFSWRSTFMLTLERNKVVKLTTESPKLVSGIRVIEEGLPINTFYMPKSAGVDPATGDLLYWVYDLDDKGNIINERISSDRALAADSKYYFGSRQPDFYGSFSTEFTFLKSFDLSFLLTFSVGGKVYDSLYAGTMDPMYIGDAMHQNLLRRWQNPGDVTDVPRLGNTSTNYLQTDRYLVDASFLSIRNITLGYTIPRSATSKIGVESFRIFCTLDNFFMFNHMNGMDPQYNFAGGNDYTYAPIKTVSLGLDINF